MQAALITASIALLIVVFANVWFGSLAANIFVDGAYKFKAAMWWIWLLVAVVGAVAFAFVLTSAVAVFSAALRLGLLATASGVTKGLLFFALLPVASFAYVVGYRLTIRSRMLRILDKGIAVGLH